MNKIIGLALIGGLALVGFTVASRLPSDALAMAVGVLFGILAGIPPALLVLAAGRRTERQNDNYWRSRAIEAEDKNRRIQSRLAGLIDAKEVDRLTG